MGLNGFRTRNPFNPRYPLLSELQPQRALNDAGTAANNSGRCADRSSNRAPNSGGDPAKICIALIVLRISEIRVVEQIEELRAELQTDSFAELEGFAGSKVVILQPWTVILVAAGSSDASSWRGFGEVRCIESRINVAIILVNSAGPYNIRPVVELVEAAEIQ